MSLFELVSLRRTLFIAGAFFFLLAPGLDNNATRTLVAAAPTRQIQHTLAGLPLSFEPNSGQADPGVKFLSRGRGYTLFLTKDQAILEMQESGVRSQESGGEGRPLSEVRGKLTSSRNSKIEIRESATHRAPDTNTASPSILRLRLLGANSRAEVVGLDELPGKSNYFIGKDPKKWRTNVPTYAKVRYHDVYPGVDLEFYGSPSADKQLEYDFIVAPGADPSAIALRVGTVREPPLRIDAAGDLMIPAHRGEIRFHKPLIYQEQESGVRSQAKTTKQQS